MAGWAPAALAFCMLAICAHVAYGSYDAVEIVRTSAMVGPGFLPNDKEFSDVRHFMDGTKITKLAFYSSSVTNISGLSVWYGAKKVDHGSVLDKALSVDISSKYPITKVEVQFTEITDSQQGLFYSFTFYSSYQSFTLGTRNSYAKTVSWEAPRGAYLGGFGGMATPTQLGYIEFIWVRPLPPRVREVGAVTPWYTTGLTTNIPYFDGTPAAINTTSSVTQLSCVLAGRGLRSGITFNYNDATQLSLGSILDQTNSLPFSAQITRIQGSFVTPGPNRIGYWGHMKFITNDGVEMTWGKPCNPTLVGSRSFDFKFPKGHWLGSVRGWATEDQLKSIQFVGFKSVLAHPKH